MINSLVLRGWHGIEREHKTLFQCAAVSLIKQLVSGRPPGLHVFTSLRIGLEIDLGGLDALALERLNRLRPDIIPRSIAIRGIGHLWRIPDDCSFSRKGEF